jgi:hypothetical protein
MYRKVNVLLFLLAALMVFLPAGESVAARRSSHKSSHVKSYYRKDGTYVHGYTRHSSTSGAAIKSSHSTSYRRSTIELHGTSALSAGSHGRHARCQTCPRDSHGHIKRSLQAKREFRKTHPCPSTGKTHGPCPGYVIDHIRALKRGGADSPGNMQWQTKEAAKQKDKIE